jgi:hypothetical protein
MQYNHNHVVKVDYCAENVEFCADKSKRDALPLTCQLVSDMIWECSDKVCNPIIRCCYATVALLSDRMKMLRRRSVSCLAVRYHRRGVPA